MFRSRQDDGAVPAGDARARAAVVPLAHTLRGLSALLAYPDAELRASVASLRDWVDTDARLAGERAGLHRLLDVIEAAGAADEIEAQLEAESAYVETFDRGRSTSLSLFEHVHGDSRDRGQAMVDLLGMYEKAGLQYATTDLPDHLPAYLEFASMQPEATAVQLLEEVDHILESIASALARRASPWAPVLVTLLRLAGVRDAQARVRPETVEDDASFAAIDRAWAEQPVNFGVAGALDGFSPQGGGCRPQSNQPREQQIRIVRRTA